MEARCGRCPPCETGSGRCVTLRNSPSEAHSLMRSSPPEAHRLTSSGSANSHRSSSPSPSPPSRVSPSSMSPPKSVHLQQQNSIQVSSSNSTPSSLSNSSALSLASLIRNGLTDPLLHNSFMEHQSLLRHSLPNLPDQHSLRHLPVLPHQMFTSSRQMPMQPIPKNESPKSAFSVPRHNINERTFIENSLMENSSRALQLSAVDSTNSSRSPISSTVTPDSTHGSPRARKLSPSESSSSGSPPNHSQSLQGNFTASVVIKQEPPSLDDNEYVVGGKVIPQDSGFGPIKASSSRPTSCKQSKLWKPY